MAALCGNRNFDIGITLFGNADTDKLFVIDNTFDIQRNNCAALVNNTF